MANNVLLCLLLSFYQCLNCKIKLGIKQICFFLTLTFYVSFFSIPLNAQAIETSLRSQNTINTQTSLPSSPETASLGEYGNFPISPYTGTANISVPVYSIKGNRIGLDLNINYITGGIKVEDRGSGSLGIGWALNAGGSISRSVKGAPDMHYNYYNNAHVFDDYYLQEPLSFDTYDFFYKTVHGHYETQPDTYFYSFNGRSGKFHIAADKRVIQTEDSDLKIIPAFGQVNATLGTMSQFTVLTSFIITDEKGTTYYFEDAEYSVLQYDDVPALAQAARLNHEYHSSWHLTKIESHDNLETINFNYSQATSNYNPPNNIKNFEYRNFIIGLIKDSGCTVTEDKNGVSGSGGIDLHYTINRKFLNEINYQVNGNQKEKLTFEYSDNTCAHSDATDQKLDNIKIYLGTNASNHKLTQHFSYYNCTDGRLVLKNTGVRSPYETWYSSQPPFSFEYHAMPLPAPTSLSQDKWGFYNGKTNSSLIPSSSISSITYAGADRSSVASFAVARNLVKVIYPTGGYTKYDYEGNQVSNPNATLILEDCSIPCPSNFQSCQANLSDCDASNCLEPTENSYTLSNLSNEFRTKGYFIIRSDYLCGTGPLPENNEQENKLSNWTGSAMISIVNNSTGLSVGQYNKSFQENTLIDTIKIGNQFNLQANTSYTLTIQGMNTRTTATTKISNSVQSPPVTIGGVRIHSIKHFDRNNIFLKGKTYKYLDQNNSQSSGIIIQEPQFQEIGTYDYEAPPFIGGCDCCYYNYTSVRLTASASYPLGSFDGSFYGYSRVEEIDLLNNAETQFEGKRVYHFHNKKKTGSIVDVIENGKLSQLDIFDVNDLIIKREQNQYAFDINENKREQNFYGFKVAAHPNQDNKNQLIKTTTGNYFWTEEPSAQTNEAQRKIYNSKWERSSNDYMKLVNYSTFLTQKLVHHYYYDSPNQPTGQISEIVSYDYSSNLNVVQPSSKTTINSNGDIHRLDFHYPDSYSHNTTIKNALINRNLLLPAWSTALYYNNNVIDGNETRFSFYSSLSGDNTTAETSHLYPEFEYRYERTWGIPTGTSIIGSLQSGAWDKQFEVKQYDPKIGKPKLIRRNHWPIDDIYDYDNVGHLLSHSYGIYSTSWTYHPDTYLLDKSTNIDGTSQSHSYDGLLRPHIIIDNNRLTETNFNYLYTNTYNAVHRSTKYPILGDVARTLHHYSFLDDIGRSYQTIEYAQGPTTNESIVSGRSFDKIGRVENEYEPFAVMNTTTPQILSGDKTSYTYDGSPLHRQKTITDPEAWVSSIDYGTNANGEVNGYSANELYKIDQYDGNQTLTTLFTDKRGNQILNRRYNSNYGNITNYDNFQYFDGKDRLTTTIPPGADSGDTDLLFRKVYAGNDLLEYEHIPGKGGIDIINSTRGQVIYKQDPLMKSYGSDLYLAMNYDSYGNLIQEGWFTNPPANDLSSNGTINIVRASHTYGTTGRSTGKIIKSNSHQITSAIPDALGSQPIFESEFSYNDAGLLSKKEFNQPLSPGSKSLKENYFYDSANNQIQSIFDYSSISSHPIKFNLSTVIDHANRIKENWYGQDNNLEKELGSYSYTAKNLIDKLIIGKDIQNINYNYQKNRLVINQLSEDFTSTLFYDSQNLGQTPRKNGDISAWSWDNNANVQDFSYAYDGVDRLTHSSNNNNVLGNWSSSYRYDMRGNLRQLSRRNGAGSQIDSLVYSYVSGNHIHFISDQASGNKSHGYNGSSTHYYEYDANGNIMIDHSRGISKTTYNHMDLPFEIIKDAANRIRYNYDFSGNLLNIVETIGGNSTTTHFIGNVEYEGDSIKRIHHEHGFIEIQPMNSGTLHIPNFIVVDETHYWKNITSDAIIFNGSTEFWGENCIELQDTFEVRLGAEFLADFKPYGEERFSWTIKDHKGNVRTILDDDGNVIETMNYFPFNLRHDYNSDPSYEWNVDGALEQTDFAKHLDVMEYRTYDRLTGRFNSVDLLSSSMSSNSGYSMSFNNPINYTDPFGLAPKATDKQVERFNLAKSLADFSSSPDDWVEDKSGNIYWDANAKSQATTKAGERYLGRNVLVGTHNRDALGNEKINSATFNLYLVSNKKGSSGTLKGNTVPADISKYGTLAEGLYSARIYKYKGDDAILIGGGGNLPTVSGNPNNPKNYDASGKLKPTSTHVMDQILFHKGNYARPSLSTSKGLPISAGCQTGGCGAGTLPAYRSFMKKATGFSGIYYLRSK